MSELDALLERIVTDPDPALWLILADWLEDRDAAPRAELLRLHLALRATCLEPEEHPEREALQARLVELLAQGVSPVVPRRTIFLTRDVQMPFAWIPPGAYLRGGQPGESDNPLVDEYKHRVTLTRGFWLGIHPVTQAQWQTVTGHNPSQYKGVDRWQQPLAALSRVLGLFPDAFRGDTLPVESISWNDCQAFVEQLEQRTGKRFRLPTDAEWEYACRAGTTTPFHFGETISTDQANYNGNEIYRTGKKGILRYKLTAVGHFPPNAWGLFDMPGNLWEWCQDHYIPYSGEDLQDPHDDEPPPHPDPVVRVVRGGSWQDHPDFCRSAGRHFREPDRRDARHGCRLVLCLD